MSEIAGSEPGGLGDGFDAIAAQVEAMDSQLPNVTEQQATLGGLQVRIDARLHSSGLAQIAAGQHGLDVEQCRFTVSWTSSGEMGGQKYRVTALLEGDDGTVSYWHTTIGESNPQSGSFVGEIGVSEDHVLLVQEMVEDLQARQQKGELPDLSQNGLSVVEHMGLGMEQWSREALGIMDAEEYLVEKDGEWVLRPEEFYVEPVTGQISKIRVKFDEIEGASTEAGVRLMSALDAVREYVESDGTICYKQLEFERVDVAWDAFKEVLGAEELRNDDVDGCSEGGTILKGRLGEHSVYLFEYFTEEGDKLRSLLGALEAACQLDRLSQLDRQVLESAGIHTQYFDFERIDGTMLSRSNMRNLVERRKRELIEE